jgi:hypothetical protein
MLNARQNQEAQPPWAVWASLSDDAAARVDDDRRVYCRACAGFVALSQARLSVNGAQEHSFVNPEGLMFRIGCFAEAPGLSPLGEPSSHWTWFTGFSWQAGVCAGCGTHLGWSYRNASLRFVALILDRVVERSGPASRL